MKYILQNLLAIIIAILVSPFIIVLVIKYIKWVFNLFD